MSIQLNFCSVQFVVRTIITNSQILSMKLTCFINPDKFKLTRITIILNYLKLHVFQAISGVLFHIVHHDF